jgi:hypothetical protein
LEECRPGHSGDEGGTSGIPAFAHPLD